MALGVALGVTKAGLSDAWSGDGQPLSLPSLPHAVWCNILLRLSVGNRLFLRHVNRSWRSLVNEPALWRDSDVDLSPRSELCHVNDSLLLAVSAKTQGTMRSLDVSGCMWGLKVDALVEVRVYSQLGLTSFFLSSLTCLPTGTSFIRQFRTMLRPCSSCARMVLARSAQKGGVSRPHASLGLLPRRRASGSRRMRRVLQRKLAHFCAPMMCEYAALLLIFLREAVILASLWTPLHSSQTFWRTWLRIHLSRTSRFIIRLSVKMPGLTRLLNSQVRVSCLAFVCTAVVAEADIR